VLDQVDQQKIKYFSQSMGDPHDLSATFKCEVKYINLDHYGLINNSLPYTNQHLDLKVIQTIQTELQTSFYFNFRKSKNFII